MTCTYLAEYVLIYSVHFGQLTLLPAGTELSCALLNEVCLDSSLISSCLNLFQVEGKLNRGSLVVSSVPTLGVTYMV